MPDARFTHVLMTRFNLATPGRELAIRTQPGWLEERFELFERYCLPSVAAQTARDFRWIIYFDKDTPPAFKDRVERLRREVDFHPYYTGLFPAEGWARSVAEVVAPETPLLLTTRLDNDDALARDFVERLHRAVAEHDNRPGSYNFRHGLIRHGPRLYAHDHPSNPFFSWLEPATDFRTACSIHHMMIADAGPVIQIGEAPAWMQIVHETNVSNRVRGRRTEPDAATVFAGASGTGIPEVGAFALAADNHILTPLRAARDRLVGLVRDSRKRR